jgi:hypothetical protein
MCDKTATQPGCVFATVVQIRSCGRRLCWRSFRWLLELLATTIDMECDDTYHRRCYMETHSRGWYIVGLKSGRMLGDGRAAYSSHNFEFCWCRGADRRWRTSRVRNNQRTRARPKRVSCNKNMHRSMMGLSLTS